MSNYIDIENNKCEGWTIPLYPCSAEQFEQEIIKYCKLVEETEVAADLIDEELCKGAIMHSRVYKYLDGTLFGVVKFTRDGESFIQLIKGKDTYSDDFDTIYYNSVQNW